MRRKQALPDDGMIYPIGYSDADKKKALKKRNVSNKAKKKEDSNNVVIENGVLKIKPKGQAKTTKTAKAKASVAKKKKSKAKIQRHQATSYAYDDADYDDSYDGFDEIPRRSIFENLIALIFSLLRQLVRFTLQSTATAVLMAFILFSAIVYIGGYYVNWEKHTHDATALLSKSAGFKVKEITLSGAHHTRHADIMNAFYDPNTDEILGRSLMHVDLTDAKTKIESLGWVQHVSISRLYPDTLHISVIERSPMAIWHDRDFQEFYLVDHEGEKIEAITTRDYHHLPMILDTKNPKAAQEVLTALADFPTLNARVTALYQRGGRRFDVKLQNGFEIKLPEQDMYAAIERLYHLEKGDGNVTGKLAYMDFKNDKLVYFKAKQ